MDVRSERTASGSAALLLFARDVTIAGECDEPPEGPLLAEVAEAQLQPRQCLIVVDSMFVEARSGAAVAVAVAVDNLYLRMRQFSPVWPEDGLVSSNGASVWLSNMTFQGQINSGPALNPFNQSHVYVSDSTFTEWVDQSGAIATVDSASSIMLDRCTLRANGAVYGALITTTSIALRTPSTIILRNSTLTNNLGVFYGRSGKDYGILYADTELDVLTPSRPRPLLSAALPLTDFNPDASAPILKAEDNPLLLPEQEQVSPLEQPQVALPRATAPAASPQPPPAPPTAGAAGDARTAAYSVFVAVCVAGIVLIACMMLALTACVLNKYKAQKKKDWLELHGHSGGDGGDGGGVELGSHADGAPVTPPLSQPPATAAAAAAYAAAAVGSDAGAATAAPAAPPPVVSAAMAQGPHLPFGGSLPAPPMLVGAGPPSATYTESHVDGVSVAPTERHLLP